MGKKKYIVTYNEYDDIRSFISHIDHKNLVNVKQVIIDLNDEEYFILSEQGFNINESKPIEYGLLSNPAIPETGTPPPIFSYFKIDQAHAAGFKGYGIKVAILDSGCDDLRAACIGNITRETFTGVAANIDTSNHGSRGCLFIGQTKNINDTGSILNYGIAYESQVYSLKCLGGTNTDIIEAIDYCITNNIDIINCSFFTTEDANLSAAYMTAMNVGIIVVCAAGNDVSGSMVFPANIPGVISINIVQNGTPNVPIGSYLNTSNNVTVTTYATGHGQTAVYGTSQGAFHTTGLLAIYKQKYPNLDTQKAIRLLQRRAIPFDGFTYNLSSNTRDILLNAETGAGFIASIN